jgi:integrase/recombinase XerD
MSAPRAPLRRALEDYLSLRRALGYKLHNAGRLLGQFVGYLEERGVDTITTEDAVAWATLPAEASPHWLAIRLSAVRGFAAHLRSIDPSVQVPPAGVLRAGPQAGRRPGRRPAR